MANTLKEIGDWLSDIVDKVKTSLQDEAMRQLIAEDLGLPPSGPVPKPNLPQDKLDSITAYRSKANPDKEAFIQLLGDVKAVYEAVRSFIASLGVSSVTTQNQVLYKLFDLFALNEVRVRAPAVYFFVQLLSTIVEDSAEVPGLTTDDLAEERFFRAIAMAEEFALSPLYYLFKILSTKDAAGAKKASDRLFPHIAGAVAYLQGNLDETRLEYGWDGLVVPKKNAPLEFTRGSSTPRADELAERMLTIGFPLAQTPSSGSSTREAIDLTFAIIPESDGELVDPTHSTLREGGLLIGVGGEGGLEIQLTDRWKFLLEASAKPAFSLFVRHGTPPRITNGSGPTDLPLNVALVTVPDAQNITYAFPHAAETHVEIGQLAFSFSFDGRKGGIKGELRRAAIVIATKDQDGFLAKFLPSDGLRVPFDFGTGFSTDRGFFTEGNIPLLSGHSTGPLGGTPAAPAVAAPAPAAPALRGVAIPLGVAVPGTTTSPLAAPVTFASRLGAIPTADLIGRAIIQPGLDATLTTATPTPPPPIAPPPPITAPPATAPQPTAVPGGGTGSTSSSGSSGAGLSGPVSNLGSATKPERGLSVVIPIGKSLLGVRVNHLLLALKPGSDPAKDAAKAEVSVSLTVKIGPVEGIIDRIGFEAGLGFPESGGNLGFADFSAGFKPPSGVGIKVDAPAVSGGGFLFLDPEKGQYAGFLQLAIEGGISVKAVGLIFTRLPDGRKGFSFLIMITVEDFRPIPLGLGFMLTGIGGLLAINRTVDQDVLREGIKNKTLNDVLFPKDPVRNAPQIFGTLNRVFPVREGSHFFGPVVQICWGTPPLVTMDLGVILEIGNRTRLIVLGRVAAILPTEKNDLIRIQMNAVGIIDFDEKSISLDAVLYDSRLVGKFPITGGMALRINWGASKEFALSIGGFHPAFKPPPKFPTLDRLAISFADSDSFRLRAEGYFAVTSNTLQWGARAELFAKAAGFSITGQIGYDVLIQFDPFGFIADFHASVQLKRGSRNLFKIAVEGELRGPRPLHLKGKATFEIFWCDFTIHIDRTLVSGEAPPKLPPVRVMEKLRLALGDPRNWTGQIGDVERAMVTLRQSQAANQIALHPLGKLSVKQTVVPLELQIARFGSATPADGRLFRINSVSVNGKGAAFTREHDFFAPGQFLDLSDDEKLAAPSFEPMVAGMSVGSDSFLFTTSDADIVEDGAITYETVVVDKANDQSTTLPEKFTIAPANIGRQIAIGAAARSDVRRALAARYQPPAAKNSQVARSWTVVSTADLSRQAIPGVDPAKAGSYAESFQAIEKVKQDDPARAKGLMLLRV
ncbi:MAG TPA: DUF6603 domain-containing protein [Gemmatimonadaceae bacterium]|nr:DUF6603 domain-containing protein [Gemmatimonadaceae bacterium]